jgi:hypothetical protein
MASLNQDELQLGCGYFDQRAMAVVHLLRLLHKLNHGYAAGIYMHTVRSYVDRIYNVLRR